uniref:Gfo/Idh/MocA family protein n=1 Tax=Pararhizobium sp. IMCC3301 TaxID=3067904 RepID=UPI00274273E7|nr:Gfo/Idh/MocA family oxidoreductase [Pararhizobium sp. IMCC3301]
MNIALIGLGMVAATHVKAIQASTAGLNLRGVYGRSETKVAAFVAEYLPEDDGSLRRYKSVEEIAEDSEIAFAIVATPPNARDTILHQLVAGGKHILLEKPIERSSRAASRFVKVCEEAGITLGIVFQHRARAVARELKALIDSGATGPIRVVEIAVPWWRPQSYYDEPGRGTYKRDGGGVLISQAIHTLDLALSFTGPVITVHAMTRRSKFHDMEAEDFVSAGLDFGNGAIGSLMASTASYPGRAESITLHCDEVSARLQSGKLELDWRDGRHEVSGEDMATGGGADPMAFTHEWHQTMIEDFANAIRSGRPPLAPGREALAVHYLIDAINRSADTESACILMEAGLIDD